MRFPRVALLIAASTLCLACPDTRRQPPEPVKLTVQGLYTHEASGMAFPERVDPFIRGDIVRYDSKGKHISAGYNLVSFVCPIAATVYIRAAGRVISIGSPPDVVAEAHAMVLQKEFYAEMRVIEGVHPGARLMATDEATLVQGGKPQVGRKAVYEFNEGTEWFPKRNTSRLYLFRYGKWNIKYRFTYPSIIDTQADACIKVFMTSLQWP